MKEIKRHLLLLSLLCCTLFSGAVIHPHFEHIDTRGHGIFCIFRDADGVVWLGTTNGLTTLAQLQSRLPYSYVRHEVLNDIIHDIKQDNVGRLWLTTSNNQLLVYDARKNKLITNVPDYLRQLGMPGINEQLTAVGPKGMVWVSDGKIIYSYDFSKKVSKKFTLPSNSGEIMALQSNGNYVIVATKRQVYGINTESHRTEHLGPTPYLLTNSRIILERDKGHNIWLAADNKLYRLGRGSSQWSEMTEVHHVKGIVTTQAGYTFVGTTNYGVFVFSPGSTKPDNLRQAPPNTDGLLSNHIEDLYYNEDLKTVVISYNKSNMSIVTESSEKYSSHSLATAANQFHHEDVIPLTNSPDGHSFWAGSEDGGMFLVENSKDMPIKENRYRGHTVTALFTDSRQHLWTGLYNEGVFSDDGRCYFAGYSPYDIVQPIEGGLLFVALLGQGIATINPLTGATGRVETDNPWLVDITSHSGKAYAVTNNFIYEIDASTLSAKKIPTTIYGERNFLQEGHRAIITDKRGWLWIVSNVHHSPLYIYETATGKHHSLKNMNKYIMYSICTDQNNNIWCTTDQGLVCIATDGNRFSFTKYPLNIHEDYHYNHRALYALPDGKIVAGTNRGIISFSPKLLEEGSRHKIPAQAPIITLLRVNGAIQQPFNPTDTDSKSYNGIVGDIIYAKELDLSYDEKNLVVECHPRGFTTEVTNPYYYNLKGYSKEWLPVTNNLIVVSNLPPGEYDLQIGTSANSEESTEIFNLLHIRIRPPFWKSPWGIALWTLLTSLILLGAYFFIRNRRDYLQQIREIEMQKKQEAQLSEMKTRFFTNVSHDLRTPLTLIIGPVDELIKRFTGNPTSDNTVNMLNTVKMNANRLLTLVNQILDVRRLESTYESLQITPTNINKLLNDQASSFMAQAEKQEIGFSIDLPAEQPIVQLDSEKVSKIVNNLLSNSFKFTSKGGTISLVCKVEPAEENSLLTLRVADTGIGISEKDMPHIFDRYYYSHQIHSSHESSGIGLSIVKQYTELMNGKVSVGKNSPHGTVFTITLPVKEVGADEEWLKANGENAGKDKLSSASEQESTLLIVDDNTDLLNFMVSSLRGEFHILTAINGEEALKILNDEQNSIDVVVSDVIMPGIDGLELTRRIKENVEISHIPVILLTAKALEEDQLEGLQMGANDYITKPFNIDILRLRINRWMQWRKTAREQFSHQPTVEPEKLTITTLDQQLLEQAVKAVSEHMHEPDFNVDQLASILGIHRTGLNRKLQFITGQTPILFIRTLRLKRARQLMEADPSQPVSQVGYQVGFNNPKNFAKYFSEEFGCKPSEFTRKLQGQEQPSSDD